MSEQLVGESEDRDAIKQRESDADRSNVILEVENAKEDLLALLEQKASKNPSSISQTAVRIYEKNLRQDLRGLAQMGGLMTENFVDENDPECLLSSGVRQLLTSVRYSLIAIAREKTSNPPSGSSKFGIQAHQQNLRRFLRALGRSGGLKVTGEDS